MPRCAVSPCRGLRSPADRACLALVRVPPAAHGHRAALARGPGLELVCVQVADAFKRALKRRNVLSALAAAKDLPQLGLADALELTVLVARKDPRLVLASDGGPLAHRFEESFTSSGHCEKG